jgi:dipeptidyl aminopeptidase/acylaminoacyl peptidase
VHPDGHTVAVVVNEAGYQRVSLRDVKTGSMLAEDSLPQQLVDEIVWSPTGEHFVCVVDQTTEPANILVWSSREKSSWPVTHYAAHIPRDVFVEPALCVYPSFDGVEIPLFVFTPKVIPEDRPAIVLLHGGPESQFCAGFHPLVQYFVMRGYTVFAPNIRGSRGYGKTFLGLDDLDKRMDSIRDLDYLHRYIAAEQLANPQRIALMGGSYGGYMTLAGLAFQPTLWAAGVDRVGMSNLVTFLENTAPWRRDLREREYGSLTHDRELLASLSPMSVIDQIQNPLLVIHGANDPRIPVAEAEQIVHELQARNRIAELIVYPDEGHGLGKFKNRLHAYERSSAFLDLHVRGVHGGPNQTH